MDDRIKFKFTTSDEADGITGEFDVVEVGPWPLHAEVDDRRSEGPQIGCLDAEHLEHGEDDGQLVDVGIAQTDLPPADEGMGSGPRTGELEATEHAPLVGPRPSGQPPPGVGRDPFEIGVGEGCGEGESTPLAGVDPAVEGDGSSGETGHESARLPLPVPRRRGTEPHPRGIDRQRPLDSRQLDAAADGAVDQHVTVAAPVPPVALATEVDPAMDVLHRGAELERGLLEIELHVP